MQKKKKSKRNHNATSTRSGEMDKSIIENKISNGRYGMKSIEMEEKSQLVKLLIMLPHFYPFIHLESVTVLHSERKGGHDKLYQEGTQQQSRKNLPFKNLNEVQASLPTQYPRNLVILCTRSHAYV